VNRRYLVSENKSKRMRILIAPDKFKGCLSAKEVAGAIGSGIHEALPDAEIELMPIADGGDGTADVICNALGGSWVTCRAHDPLGRQIDCRYGLIEDSKLAAMEMSEAAGMRCLGDEERDPLRATTFGVGEMILDAVRRGAEKILIGLGGSATNEGGFGMARALGFRFFDSEGIQIRTAITKLRTLTRIEPPRNLTLPSIVAAVDVQNPLLGRNGATRVFGPQKGAAGMELLLLEKCLKRMARVAARQVRPINAKAPGMGAAGGLGFGLVAFAGATLEPGFPIVAEIIGADARVGAADVVITGEGRFDAQTLSGKGPAGIATLARDYGKPVFAIVGEIVQSARGSAQIFHGIHELRALASSTAESMTMARDLLRKCARDMAKDW
jgi:glycerate kinase